MKKISLLDRVQKENIKPLEDNLIFSLTDKLIYDGNAIAKTKSPQTNKNKRVKLIEAYIEQILKMTSNYDRFVKQSLYNEIEATLIDLEVNKGFIDVNNLRQVTTSLEPIQYKEFLKANISGVKNPKDKIMMYLQFHVTNISLLNS